MVCFFHCVLEQHFPLHFSLSPSGLCSPVGGRTIHIISVIDSLNIRNGFARYEYAQFQETIKETRFNLLTILSLVSGINPTGIYVGSGPTRNVCKRGTNYLNNDNIVTEGFFLSKINEISNVLDSIAFLSIGLQSHRDFCSPVWTKDVKSFLRKQSIAETTFCKNK